MSDDPIEQIIADGLTAAGIKFERGRGKPIDTGLDFYLPAFDVHIEVKQFHSPRIAEQMARAENVIAIQGRRAAEAFASLLPKGVRIPEIDARGARGLGKG